MVVERRAWLRLSSSRSWITADSVTLEAVIRHVTIMPTSRRVTFEIWTVLLAVLVYCFS